MMLHVLKFVFPLAVLALVYFFAWCMSRVAARADRRAAEQRKADERLFSLCVPGAPEVLYIGKRPNLHRVVAR